MSSYISDCHLQGSEFLCPSPNNLSQMALGHNCCREHRLMLRDHPLHQHQDTQQPWALLGSLSLGTLSTSAMAGKHSLGFRTENPAQKLLRQGNCNLLQAFPLCPGLNPCSARPSGILLFQCFGHCLSTATLLSRSLCKVIQQKPLETVVFQPGRI